MNQLTNYQSYQTQHAGYQNYPENTAAPYSAAPPAIGLNPLICATIPLLTLLAQIRQTNNHGSVPKLKGQVADEIKRFEQRLMKLDYDHRTILAARYCMCAAIDEAVLSRPWGSQSVWASQSLLALFHKETWGGERFYIILENLARDPRKNLDLLELCYVLLSLGFEGKFFDKDSVIREEIRNRIFYQIRNSRHKIDKSLTGYSEHQLPLAKKSTSVKKLKKIVLSSCVAILLIGTVFNIKTYNAAKPVLQQLSAIGLQSPITTFSQLLDRPIVVRNKEDS